jgi:hypothetical protein
LLDDLDLAEDFRLDLVYDGRGGDISGVDIVDSHPGRGLHASRCELGAMVRSELGMICSPAEPRHV